MLTTEEGETSKRQEASIIKKVLVVDDNKNNRLILKETFSLKNIQVDEAQNGFDALQLIENNDDYDAVLMDLNMPYMNGLETIKKIRENFTGVKANIPVLLLHSSSEDDYILKQCKELSVKFQLVKPIKNKDLFEALSRLNSSTVAKVAAPVAEIDKNKYSSKLKVLIAEDNTINMFLAKTIVMKVSPEVQIIEATDGLAAYEMAVKHLPDIILMDIQMPVMSGHEATRKINGDPLTREIPIVAITAGNIKGEREKCMESGMVDFVPKPIVEKNIRDIFDKWLKEDEPQKRDEELRKREEESSINSNKSNNKEHFDVDKVKEYLGNEPEIIKEVLKLTIQELEAVGISFKLEFEDV
jgi:CheY-like chemotaxis protein